MSRPPRALARPPPEPGHGPRLVPRGVSRVLIHPERQPPRAYFVWISVPATTEPVTGLCGTSMTQTITRSSGQDSADG